MIGKRTPDGPIGMPVILDEDTWRRVQSILTDPSRPIRPSRGRRLLSGLVKCARCGHTMMGHRVKGRPRYACYKTRGGCGKTAIVAEPLDEHVSQVALQYAWQKYHESTFDITSIRQRASAEREEIEAQIAALKGRLYPLMDMYTAGELSLGEWQRAREGLDTQIVQLERQLSSVRTAPQNSILEVNFQSGDTRHWLENIVNRVVIHPSKVRGRRFDPSRVEIEWCM